MLKVIFAAILILGMSALVVSWIVAEIRAEIWVRTPDPDPWVKRRID